MIPTFTDPDTGAPIDATSFSNAGSYPWLTTEKNTANSGASITIDPKPVFYGVDTVSASVRFTAPLAGGTALFAADYDIPFTVSKPAPPDAPPQPPKASWAARSVFAGGARRVTAYLVGWRTWQPSMPNAPLLFDALMTLGSTSTFSVTDTRSSVYQYEVRVSDAGDVQLYSIDGAPLLLTASNGVYSTLALEVEPPAGADIYGVSIHTRTTTAQGPIMGLVRAQGDDERMPVCVPSLCASPLSAIASTGSPTGGAAS